MSTDSLKQLIATAPKTPGVYIWRDDQKKPLYVGKAANLKSRLSSYLKTTDTRIVTMIEEAVTVEWRELETDIEALIAESQLIKELRPKFNIVMRDDKRYFYVIVTDDEFPKLILTHQPSQALGSRPLASRLTPSVLAPSVIGPFTEGLPLKTTLRVLRRLFPYCTCKQKHHLRCLNAHIGKCLGYCCLKSPATPTQRREYAKNIRAIQDVLTGKRDALVKRLARQLPDVALRLLRVFQNAQINTRQQALAGQHHGALAHAAKAFGLINEPHRIEGYDIANISGEHAAGAMVVFTDGRADREQYRLFNIKEGAVGDVPMLRQVLERRMRHDEWPLPDLIVVDGAKAQMNAAVSIVGNIPVIAITKNDHHQAESFLFSLKANSSKLSSLPRELRDLLVHIDSEAHRFSISHYRKRHGRALTRAS